LVGNDIRPYSSVKYSLESCAQQLINQTLLNYLHRAMLECRPPAPGEFERSAASLA